MAYVVEVHETIKKKIRNIIFVANVSAIQALLQRFLQHYLCCKDEDGAGPLDGARSNDRQADESF